MSRSASWLALVLVTCACASATSEPTRPTPHVAPLAVAGTARPVRTDAGPGVATEPVPEPRAEWVAPSTVGTSPEGNLLPQLPRFFSALLHLAQGARSTPVRIAWLGDSHTQPDIWTHAVRTPLQDRFGTGGPGFVHVGWKKWGYRHAGAELSVVGQWRIEPPRLLAVQPYDDGVLGLGGVRLVPRRGAGAAVRTKPGALPGPARWELTVRFPRGRGALRIIPSEGDPVDIAARPGSEEFQHVSWMTRGPGGGFSVEATDEGAELFGVVVESEGAPGVVLDVLGLNGARVVHALGWDDAAWRGCVQRRQYDLVVLAYGTNEAGIRELSMEGHTAELVRLLDRVRAASPHADCLIIGAMDRGGVTMSEKVERLNGAQEAAAKARGCAFWSAQRAMGGKGSMQKWLDAEPPLATKDRVHLHVRGYQRLGSMLSRDILRACDDGSHER
jgi:lysophospholipase L1-like esterase